MELKDTVHLPKTAFPMRAALNEREPIQLKAWEDAKLYDALLENNAKNPKYVMHDGPPYANGAIHLGHVLNKVLKDIIVKFHTMDGKLTDYVPGWDCHGLPIELQVDKKLGPKKRELTPGQFRKICRAYANEQLDAQRREFKRLGIFGRWDDPYTTMAFDYEAQTVRELARFAERGALYRRKRPVHWCIKDQTALAEAEVEYEEKTSPTVYAAFDVVNGEPLVKAHPQLEGKKLRLAIWTTVPWSIPANLAVAVGASIVYVAYQLGQRGVVVVAKALLPSFLAACAPEELAAPIESAPPALAEPKHILAEFTGKEMVGVTYAHMFLPDARPVLLGEHATEEAGTGLVGTSPGHGEDDYRLALAHGIPIFAPVDAAGRFTAELAMPELVGMKVFDANEPITEMLLGKGALLNASGKAIDIRHSYPHCWRCRQPVIFRATDQWWIGLDTEIELKPGVRGTVRKAALAAIDTLAANGGFVPSWGKERIRGMVANRPDWCISRQRNWGVPIPVAYCKECREPHVSAKTMEHVAGFFEKEGADAWFDRPLTELLPAGTACAKCGVKEFVKETDILDVWFDSGSSFAAVLKSGKWPLLQFPADLYLEGSDQHRGWFNSSLTIGIGAHGEAPFKQVLTHGFVVDGEGRKMSKSMGNTLAPEGLIKKYGAEVLRLWVAASDYRDDIRLSNNILDTLADGYRKIRNTLRYCLSQLFDYDPAKDAPHPSELSEIDAWALSRLERYRATADAAYRSSEFHRLYHSTVDFCAVDLSAFYFDVIKDRTYCSGEAWTERRAAQSVLHQIADTLCRILAPVASFTAEEAWAQMPAVTPAKEKRVSSVFLAGMPKANPGALDEPLEEELRHLRSLRERVNARLEEKRGLKEIGKATEADVTLTLSAEAMAGPEGAAAKKYAPLLADLFLVANVTLVQGEPGSGHRFDAFVEKSSNTPCARCYRALADVTQQDALEGAPFLCARCVRAIAGEA